MTKGSELFLALGYEECIIMKSVDPDRNEDLSNATEELANFTQKILDGATEQRI